MTIKKTIAVLSSKQFLVGAFFVFAFIMLAALLRLSNAPLQDNDEGIYTTTFLLVSSGHQLYRETFFSQAPGFFLALYPGFLLFGKSLIAARLSLGIWTLIGIVSIFWLGHELKKPQLSLLMIGTLLLIPFFTHQFFILQSDMLVNVFSLLCLASLFRYYQTVKTRWLLLAVGFCTIVFWTKLNFFLVLPILSVLFLLYQAKKLTVGEIFKQLLWAGMIGILLSLCMVVPFGATQVLQNILGLRLAASNVSSSNILTYLTQNVLLFGICISTIALLFRENKWLTFPVLPLVLWNALMFLVFSIYRPFFPHHMSMIVLPLVLLWSVLVVTALKKRPWIFSFLAVGLFIMGVSYYGKTVVTTPQGILTTEQKNVVRLIAESTLPEDTIVTDDEILYSASNHLPPPELADISLIRVQSHSLTPQEFKHILDTYKPKLILPRTGRLTALENFSSLLIDYDVFAQEGDKTIYIRKNKAYVKNTSLEATRSLLFHD